MYVSRDKITDCTDNCVNEKWLHSPTSVVHILNRKSNANLTAIDNFDVRSQPVKKDVVHTTARHVASSVNNYDNLCVGCFAVHGAGGCHQNESLRYVSRMQTQYCAYICSFSMVCIEICRQFGAKYVITFQSNEQGTAWLLDAVKLQREEACPTTVDTMQSEKNSQMRLVFAARHIVKPWSRSELDVLSFVSYPM